jgi:hypothetical protein
MSKLSKAIANAIIEFNGGLLTQDELYQKLEQDIDDVSVKVWREDKSVPLPTYGREGDACCDVYAKSIEYDSDKDRFIIHTINTITTSSYFLFILHNLLIIIVVFKFMIRTISRTTRSSPSNKIIRIFVHTYISSVIIIILFFISYF